MVTATRYSQPELPNQPARFLLHGGRNATAMTYLVWHFNFTTSVVHDAITDNQERLEAEQRAHFRDLADWWHIDTDGMSSDRHKFQHDAYQRIIIEMGKAAIPYMLEDLKARGGHWYTALQQLTGLDYNSSARGDLKRARKAWLDWGKTNH